MWWCWALVDFALFKFELFLFVREISLCLSLIFLSFFSFSSCDWWLFFMKNTKDNPPCNTLFIGNLGENINEEELRGLFSAYVLFLFMPHFELFIFYYREVMLEYHSVWPLLFSQSTRFQADENIETGKAHSLLHWVWSESLTFVILVFFFHDILLFWCFLVSLVSIWVLYFNLCRIWTVLPMCTIVCREQLYLVLVLLACGSNILFHICGLMRELLLCIECVHFCACVFNQKIKSH